RYDITQRIANGGMATVYRAVDGRLDREVALKILQPSMAEDPAVITKFATEAKNSAKINHPNAINVYDQGVGSAGDSNVTILAMEFIAGQTLRDVMSVAGRMPVKVTWGIAVQEIRVGAGALDIGIDRSGIG